MPSPPEKGLALHPPGSPVMLVLVQAQPSLIASAVGDLIDLSCQLPSFEEADFPGQSAPTSRHFFNVL